MHIVALSVLAQNVVEILFLHFLQVGLIAVLLAVERLLSPLRLLVLPTLMFPAIQQAHRQQLIGMI